MRVAAIIPKHKKSFTFIETMISLLIIGIVLAMGAQMLQRTRSISSRQSQAAIIQSEARGFLLRFQKDIRETILFKKLNTDKVGAFNSETDGVLNKLTMLTPSGEVSYEFNPKERALYRQVQGQARRPVLTEQIGNVQIWGVKSALLPPKGATTNQKPYNDALRKNTYRWGVKKLRDIKGIIVRLTLNEYDGKTEGVKAGNRKILRQRTIETKVFSRTLLFRQHLEF